MNAIWVEITKVRGSAPRDAGTAMKVTKQGIRGTTGGGALEYQAIATARELLDRGATEDVLRKMPLGPGLGQCCGGVVTLRFTREERAVDMEHFIVNARPTDTPHPKILWIWGAGHVGRAIVAAAPPRAFKMTWVDTDPERFPKRTSGNPKIIPAADPALLARRAPPTAHHLILTYSHDIDFALCAALLERGAASIGLIGSDTKRTRFFKRLRELGLDPSPIVCPIGDKSLGKRPDRIAKGVLDVLLTKEAA